MWNEAFSGIGRFPGEPLSETRLVAMLAEALRARLPLNWRVEVATGIRRGGARADALLTITDPRHKGARIVVEAKRKINPIDVPLVVSQLRKRAQPGEAMLAIAPYLGPRARRLLEAERVGYADATGNLYLTLDQPAIYIERTGASTNPWKERQAPLRSLKGPTSGRVVRALCDFQPPYGITGLAERSRTSASSVSRVVGLIEREALLTRDQEGAIMAVRWPELIQRWAQDYGVLSSNTTHAVLEPRGLDALLGKLRDTTWEYAVTGALAAERVAPFAPPRLATIYVRDAAMVAKSLGLRPAERGANMLLVEPFDPVVFDRTVQQDGITYAALSQVAADLLTGSGREPNVGDTLLRWMEAHQDAWRE